MINLVTFFLNKVYKNLETVGSYSDNWGIESKEKSSFLLIWVNKDSLCLDIQTYFYITYIKSNDRERNFALSRLKTVLKSPTKIG